MNIGLLLERRAIAARLGAADKRQVLSVIADIAAREFGLKGAAVLDALEAREDAGSTGIGQGVAVPHARLPGLDRVRGVFIKLETPAAFESVDGQPVDLVFALLAPESAGAEHLLALASVSRLLRRADIREQLRNAATPDALHLILVGDELHRTAA